MIYATPFLVSIREISEVSQPCDFPVKWQMARPSPFKNLPGQMLSRQFSPCQGASRKPLDIVPSLKLTCLPLKMVVFPLEVWRFWRFLLETIIFRG